MAQEPGHDINYLALTGALAAIGTADTPVLPLNLVADYGGGSLLLCLGVLAAVFETQRSGRGQVVDSAMVDGVGLLTSIIYQLANRGQWVNQRHSNMLDGAAPYYGVYRCSDGKFLAVGAMEMKFRAALADVIGVARLAGSASNDPSNWAAIRAEMEQVFATATRDEWVARMAGRETCCTPVLDLTEAPHHPHNQARSAFVATPGGWDPSPAPRFSLTPGRRPSPLSVEAALEAFGSSWSDV